MFVVLGLLVSALGSWMELATPTDASSRRPFIYFPSIWSASLETFHNTTY